MYAVIFTAIVAGFDDEYVKLAEKMKHLAMTDYGCIEFNSCTEGDREIAISYWHDLDQIKRWKANVEHLQVQSRGRSTWYRSYKVEITKIERSYEMENLGKD
ncbi:MAG: antibiotic biosynthesis monooxygenase [Moraxellaceae bacterium]|nr:MAG: antibiotic biosynthesis monooxygenase [Moraxellaceae bacterium]